MLQGIPADDSAAPNKALAVLQALRHPKGAKMSDRQIAEHVGVSDRMVNKYRSDLASTAKLSQSEERTGRDGRTINTANIGKANREVKRSNTTSRRQLELQPHPTNRSGSFPAPPPGGPQADRARFIRKTLFFLTTENVPPPL